MAYYTQEGLDRLKAELHDLKTRGRRDIAQQIAEARDKGDLSENAEYDAAKDAQGLLEMRISELENSVAQGRVIDESKLDTSKVSILSTVKIKNLKANMEMSYTLVAEEEANTAQKKISVSSPIGKGLLGNKIGDIVKIKVPAGQIEVEILDITYS
ncbi:MAG: transcription elongation factor GreA [Cytophagales bacterium]|nr:transcription elongation factor GreA [Cytophagales bacterium]